MKTNGIILSKYAFQLIKEHLRRDQKIEAPNKQKLIDELKSAAVISSKEIPGQVVAINTKVEIRDLETDQLHAFELVAPDKAKIKNNRLSVLCPIGLASIGYNQGDEVVWEMPDGEKRYLIESVSPGSRENR